MIRNRYTFSRPLTRPEYLLLIVAINERPGSTLIFGAVNEVIGVVAHPDDLEEFQKELRPYIRQKTAHPLQVEQVESPN
jgi:hypothetical protein